MTERAFQEQLNNLNCFGCGPHNDLGLHVKSYWSSNGGSVCRFTPSSHHSAGPKHIVNGGIIATVMDCHTVCTAMADGYRREARSIGDEGPDIIYVTGSLHINYAAPAFIDNILAYQATIVEVDEKRTVLKCEVTSADVRIATGRVVAVRVPENWGDPK